ncbi:hypothetical protein Leryth_021599 [Lithospermum erythrorhizon]|nr:hypothetical protein Leryth_021599 [Lithospermum erythrorhizon]
MSNNVLTSISRFHLPFLALPFIFWAVTALPFWRQPNKTKLLFYVHDYLTGHDASALTVAGKDGATTSILQFGTLLVVDDKVTEGPDPNSKEIGRAQGIWMVRLYGVFYRFTKEQGSTLEIQGADLFAMKEREFSVVSGTGYFRFVRGYGIMTTEFLDVANLRGILKLDITVKHDYY